MYVRCDRRRRWICWLEVKDTCMGLLNNDCAVLLLNLVEVNTLTRSSDTYSHAQTLPQYFFSGGD